MFTAVVLILVAAVAAAIMLAVRRASQQRAAHDARMKAMAAQYLAAARKMNAPKPPAPAASTPIAEPVREERECPFCAERILVRARLCRFCGREVPPVPAA